MKKIEISVEGGDAELLAGASARLGVSPSEAVSLLIRDYVLDLEWSQKNEADVAPEREREILADLAEVRDGAADFIPAGEVYAAAEA